MPLPDRPHIVAVAAAGLLVGCAEPKDVLFTPTAVPPQEVSPGVFRVTWSRTPDVVRGFTADGARIVYQGRDVPGFGPGSYVLSVSVTEGDVREEAAGYRRALLDAVTHVVFGPAARLLVTWRAPEESAISCRRCPAPPPAFEIGVRRLPPQGIVPLSHTRTRVIRLPNHATTDATCAGEVYPDLFHHIRIRPAELEIRTRSVNPFGPVEATDGSVGFYSDGEATWRYEPADPAAAPDSVGLGAFPALSPDGLLLAVAVPTGLDSVGGFCQDFLCCQQETIRIDATGWQIVLYDVNGPSPRPLAPGVEPAFDPLAPRIAVRRSDALHWVDLASGEAREIPGTAGGYAPAVSPDGAVLAFTADTFGNGDVFYVKIR